MLKLAAKLRSGRGRKNQAYRQQGFVPAILYGRQIENIPLLVEAGQFEKIYQQAGESVLVKLKIAGLEKNPERVVLVHQVSRDPLTDKFIHIDFYQVRMDEPIRTEVSLVFKGESPAVEKEGGILVKNIQEVEVEALPLDLPKEIEVDVSQLEKIDQHLYVKDLKIDDKVKVLTEEGVIVASVVAPRTQAELEELERAPEEAMPEPELVEKREKIEKEEEPVEEIKPEDKGPEASAT